MKLHKKISVLLLFFFLGLGYTFSMSSSQSDWAEELNENVTYTQHKGFMESDFENTVNYSMPDDTADPKLAPVGDSLILLFILLLGYGTYRFRSQKGRVKQSI